MSKFLVLGAGGMLGRDLVVHLAAAGHSVAAATRKGLEGTDACDLSDEGSVRELVSRVRPDAAVHCAAFSDVDGCEKDPEKAFSDNALSERNVSLACARAAVPHVYISTDYVFDGGSSRPYREEDPVFPVNRYGMTKLAGERYALSGDGPAAVLRTSWLFGPGNPKSFVNAIAARIADGRREISVLADQEDSPTYTKDLSAAVERVTRLLMEKAAADRKTKLLFHFCNKGVTTRLEMTRAVRDLMGRHSLAVRETSPAAIPGRLAIRPKRTPMDTSRYESVFGERIRNWQESLKDYLGSIRT